LVFLEKERQKEGFLGHEIKGFYREKATKASRGIIH
jgi:hypothetical protein